MKTNQFFSSLFLFFFFMHTAIISHPFLGKNPELEELRLTEKQMRQELKRLRLEKKKEQQTYHLRMMQLHGCEKQKRFVADQRALKTRQQAFDTQRIAYEQAVKSVRQKMEEKKKDRFMANTNAAQQLYQEKIQQAQKYHNEKKEIRLARKNNAWGEFYVAKAEKSWPKLPSTIRKKVKNYGIKI